MCYSFSFSVDTYYSKKDIKLSLEGYLFIPRRIFTYPNWNIKYRQSGRACLIQGFTCWSPLHSSKPHKLVYAKSTKRVILPKAN